MKLLLDQGLPRGAAQLLTELGFDTIHVGDIGMAGATDTAILEYGRSDQRVVITLDADFHALLALSYALQPSVIRIRIEGLRAAALTELVRMVIESCSEDLQLGAVAVVQEDRIRVRRLPLVPLSES